MVRRVLVIVSCIALISLVSCESQRLSKAMDTDSTYVTESIERKWLNKQEFVLCQDFAEGYVGDVASHGISIVLAEGVLGCELWSVYIPLG